MPPSLRETVCPNILNSASLMSSEMLVAYASQLLSLICTQGTTVTEVVTEKLRKQFTVTGREMSKFSFAGLHVQQESVWFLL